ncbi:MAG: MFS transporter [Parvibaculaceae bacterium]
MTAEAIAAAPAAYDDARARRNALILAAGQALFGSATVIMFTTAGLVGIQLAPTKALATAPITAYVIGTAISTVPAALLMKKIGRKAGFMLGGLAGTIGGVVGIYAIYQRAFWLLLLCAALQGMFQAFIQHSRFAAADMASPAFKPKAVAWVMTGGVAAAIFGTGLVMATVNLLAPVTFAGCFLAMTVLSALTIAVMALLDIPQRHEEVRSGTPRPLAAIVKQPVAIVAIATAALSYAMMNFVMTAAPIAMIDCGFTTQSAAWVIQWHVLAMFVPSFFAGHMIARYGAVTIAMWGMALLSGAALAGLFGISFSHFAINLVLLGLGWNFGFIGGTTLLTQCYRPEEREKVQGFNDFVVFGTVAVASLTSGKLLDLQGWQGVNVAVFPAVALAATLILWSAIRRKASA